MAPADAAWQPSHDFLTNSRLARLTTRLGFGSYDELRDASVADIEWFWGAVAEDLAFEWLEPPTSVLDRSRGNPWPDWFPGGVTNLVLSCVDRHDPASVAYVWEGEEGVRGLLSAACQNHRKQPART